MGELTSEIASCGGAGEPDVRARRSKFRAVRTTVDGITFASKAEARRYQELRLLEKAGVITELELQPRYQLAVNNMDICEYRADFTYR